MDTHRSSVGEDGTRGSSYLGHYPVGAFVVRGPRAIGPIVAALRAMGRLKQGENVTPFLSAPRCRSCPSLCCCSAGTAFGVTRAVARTADAAKCSPAPALRISVVEAAAEEQLDAVVATYDVVVFSVGAKEEEQQPNVPSSPSLGDAVADEWRRAFLTLADNANDGNSNNNKNSTNSNSPSLAFFAIHATGEWSNEDFEDLAARCSAHSSGSASASAPLPPPLVYVCQLRTLSAACIGGGGGGASTADASSSSSSSPVAIKRRAFAALLAARRMKKSSTTAAEAATDCSQQQQSFTFSELFGGIGMFRLGLERAGGRSVFAVEWAQPARVIYEQNFGTTDRPFDATISTTISSSSSIAATNAAASTTATAATATSDGVSALAVDITEIPTFAFPPHDVLTAGFPCQSFAKAGAQEGLHSSKGWLFYEVVRALVGARPRVFLLENVANLVDVEEGEQLAEIMRCLRDPSAAFYQSSGEREAFVRNEELEAKEGNGLSQATATPLSYDVSYRVIDGSLATPQARRRVYFLGVRKDSTDTSGIVESSGITPERSSNSNNSMLQRIDAALEAAATVLIPEARRNSVNRGESFAEYKCLADVLEVRKAGDVASNSGSGLFLTPAQMEAVSRSRTFRQDPRWRIADLGGLARTLMGSYRASYQLYSEFVPLKCVSANGLQSSAFEHSSSLLSSSAQNDSVALGANCGDAKTSTDVVYVPSPEAIETDTIAADFSAAAEAVDDSSTSEHPPFRAYRFFSLREAARLQGIPDAYTFASERTRGVTTGAMYKLVGNAVNPLIIEGLGRAIVATGLLR